MTFYYWRCTHGCQFTTKNEPDEAWAEADRDHHIATRHPADPWQRYELLISHYSFKEPR